uniref:Uncharacterized protein n=1 Tax=viral metagenome TaxID=1070528 RepID=A0A6M3Y2I4_9ZZZZ
MNKQGRYSEIINSVSMQILVNNDMDFLKNMIRAYCEFKNYAGELLNSYNKTYQLNDLGFRDYLFNKFPKKHMVGLYEFMKS